MTQTFQAANNTLAAIDQRGYSNESNFYEHKALADPNYASTWMQTVLNLWNIAAIALGKAGHRMSAARPKINFHALNGEVTTFVPKTSAALERGVRTLGA